MRPFPFLERHKQQGWQKKNGIRNFSPPRRLRFGMEIHMEEWYILQAEKKDLPRTLEIYAHARAFMRKNGKESQWRDNFPPQELLLADIEAGNLYVVKERERIHGVFAFIIGEDPAYAVIEQGGWLSDTEYGTLHRVAGDGEAKGIFNRIVSFAGRRSPHLRIDTHSDNQVMQHLITQNGFSRCGIIHVADGSPRIAYERL